jgi:hypothetical protein
LLYASHDIPRDLGRSPSGAVGECDLGADVCHINDSAGSYVLRSVNDQLESNFNFVGDVLRADLILTETKGSTLSRGGRALAPADGSNAISLVVTLRVAKGSALNLVLVADERRASSSAV